MATTVRLSFIVRVITNHNSHRTGALWEGRYKSTLVDSETYLLRVYRYIELNPVRADMVDHASEYLWSSYRCNAKGKGISLIRPHNEYLRLGQTNNERQEDYRSLFKDSMTDKDFAAIRKGTNQAWPLGDARFKEQIEQKTGGRRCLLAEG